MKAVLLEGILEGQFGLLLEIYMESLYWSDLDNI